MRLLISAAELPGVSMAAVRDPGSGRRLMPERRGRGLKEMDYPKRCSGASDLMSRARIRMSFTRRWKWGPAPEPVAKSKLSRVPARPLLQLHHLRRLQRL